MSRVQVVRFLDPHVSWLDRLVPDVYEVDETQSKPSVWLQRLCNRVLRRLGKPYGWREMTVQHHVVDLDDLAQRLAPDLLEDAYHIRAKRLLVGPEEYKYLLNIVSTIHLSSKMPKLWVEYKHMYQRDNNRAPEIEVNGLMLECIPWMEGYLLLP